MQNDGFIINTSIFFFAHQDDEFGVFQTIVDEVLAGNKVYCIYFTDGVRSGISPKKRNGESLKVLEKLGVPPESVMFIGENLMISDGTLVDCLPRAKQWLSIWLSNIPTIQNIYIPAWEGGHPDHDSLHAVVVIVAKYLNLLDHVWQFPLYNGYRCWGKFFRVLSPLPTNGFAKKKKISIANRLRFLTYVFHYPSQAVTWFGLSPFVLMHFILSGSQYLQRISITQIKCPPHTGNLYYEKRRFCTWGKVLDRINSIY
jgi:hypothetical protein